MDLQSIKTKLIQTVNTLNQSDAGVQVDWAGGPQLPVSPRLSNPSQSLATEMRPGVEFAAAVDVLQRRTGPGGMADRPVGGGVPGVAQATPAVVYLRRLRVIADKINHLSAEQELAIAELRSLQAHLAQVSSQGQATVTPVLDLNRAALAAAEVDSWGNILLAYRTLAPERAPEPTTGMGQGSHSSQGGDSRVAGRAHSYSAASSPSAGGQSLVADILSLGQEPLALLSALGSSVKHLALGLTHMVAPRSFQRRPPQRSRASLSLVDAVLWLGGGVIGRLALNLLLTAFPALWSVAMVAITAVTASALYRATLAPQLNFGPALRVGLLVLGLFVGGQI
ncbi:hypothetical protein IQ254_24530 [Nodosilinea sp. LEGE 07088]|uniref:hypothetical protein n=1 Tax=Nodosilinea sp. LEGE 07088 TaxID=2777968 RepID=UPI00187F2903|nr:hypothetical protein [Nodosilinea sp. LEGE 07088]MBE9140326.1 hypothetical protein [Nodosilinea sp. LEGE 07088]